MINFHGMKYMSLKKRYLFLILIVCLFAVSAVSGAEIGNDTNMLENSDDSGLMAESVNEDVLAVYLNEEEIQGSADNGTFTALQKKINGASEGSIINLENNYNYDSGFSTKGITINKTLTINGNGYTIDALGESRIFYITSPTITLENITFKNGHSDWGGAIYFAGSVSNSTIFGEFINNTVSGDSINYGGAIYFAGCVSNSTIFGEFINNTVSGGGFSCGGAISFNNVSNSNISGEFVNNTVSGAYLVNYGGAIYFSSSGVSDSTIFGEFINNTASGLGGAISFESDVSDSTIFGEFINNTASRGGAISFISVSNSTIFGEFINNTVSDGNSASNAGAIYFAGSVSNSTISGEFINNTASGLGGAIHFYDDVSDSSISSEFINNTASSGGAIYFSRSVSNSSISGNFIGNTVSSKDGTWSYGGAIYFSRGVSNSIISGMFINNTASRGGAIYCSDANINNCEFYNNSASDGGAIYCSDANINNCEFYNNSASDGGAIYAKCCSQIINCVFNNNSASNNGGAICVDYDSYDYSVNNSKFYNNSAVNGGAIFIEEGYGGIFSNLTLINNAAIYGGAFFSKPDGMTTVYIIKDSNFINNFGDYGSSIFISNEGMYSHSTRAEILDSYFYSNDKKELIYSKFFPISQYNYLFLKNNTMISPISYKIYSNRDSISSNKYLISDDKTCYINKVFPLTYTDDNKNKIRLDTDILVILTDLNNEHLSFKVNATFNSTDGCYYMYSNQSGIFNVSVNSTNVTCIPRILKINSLSPDLSINVNNAVYSENTTFIVNVAVDTIPINEGVISFYIDNKKIGVTNVSNGLATFDYAYLKVGTFNILAIYEENDNYLSSNATATFTVNKMPTVLSAKSVIFDKKGDKTFTTDLKDNNSIGVSGQNVKIETIKYSGESRTFNGITNVDGIAEYDVNSLEGGMWFVIGTYDGNENYINSKFSDKFIVIRMDTATNIEGIDEHPIVNHTYKLKANIHDENGKLVKEGIVQFYLDGVDIGSIDLSKNTLSKNDDLLGVCNLIFDYKLGDDDSYLYIEYTPSKVGNYTLSAVYEGTTIYKSSNETTTLIVGEEEPYNISAPDVIKDYGGSENLEITLTKGDTPIANANVNINLLGKDYTKTTDSKGKAYMPINLNAGSYDAVVSYEDVSATAKVTVNQLTTATTLSYVNNTCDSVILTAVVNPSTATGNIVFNVNGKAYTVEISNGKATYDLTNLVPGFYSVKSTYNGDTNHKISTSNSIKFNSPDYVIDVQDVSVDYDVSKDLVITLSRGGTPIANANVNINLLGKDYTKTTDSKGKAYMPINLNAGSYDAVVSYGDVSATAKVTVNQLNTVTALSYVNNTYDSVTLTASVDPSTVTGDVVFNVNGKDYTVEISGGKATYKLSDLAPGSYSVKATYQGDTNHKTSTSNTIKFNSPDYVVDVPDVSVDYGVSKDLEITLTRGGTPIANANVNINLLGKDYTKTTDSKGKAYMPINLNAGSYDAVVSYENVSATAKVTVNQLTTVASLSYINNSYDSVTLTASVDPSTVTGDVVFNVNGKDYAVEISGGKATYKLSDLGAGSYTVKAVYGGDVNHKTSTSNTVQFTVPEHYAVISAPDVSKRYGGSEKLEITLTNQDLQAVSNAEIRVSLAGKNYTLTTDNKGKASLDLNMDSGNYIADIVFEGNAEYEKVNAISKITINKITTQTSLSATKNSRNNYTLTADVNPIIITGDVVFTVNGNNYTAKISGGKATYILSDLDAGSYDAEATYNGEINYKSSSSNSISFTVKESKYNISAPDVTKYYGGSERFVVTIMDKTGNPVANEPVKVTINGQAYDRKTGADGRTTFAINLRSGIYEATTEYDDDIINSKITVKTTVISNDITKIFRNGTNYEASFLDKNGNKAPAGEKVSININGVFYQRTIKDDGSISFALNLEQGTYVLTLTNPYTGEEISNTVKIQPNIVENNDLVKYYRNGSQFTFKLLDDKGNPAAGQKASININGVFYTRTTNEKGIATFQINLEPGTYILTLEYKGCRVSNRVTVLSVIQSSDIKMKYHDGTRFKVTVLDGAGKPFANQNVTFNINGVFYYRTTKDDGSASLAINLMAGEYIITSTYNSLNVSNKVTIS